MLPLVGCYAECGDFGAFVHTAQFAALVDILRVVPEYLECTVLGAQGSGHGGSGDCSDGVAAQPRAEIFSSLALRGLASPG